MRRYACVFAAALGLAGCGSDAVPHRSSSVRLPGASGRTAATLVFMQRNGGLAATLDTVTVRSDGSVRLERRYGGAGGRFTDFRIRSADLRRVRARVDSARLADPGPPHGSADAHGYTYIVRGAGHTVTAVAGAVPTRLRPLVTILDGILDGDVRRESVSEVAVSDK
jgi:hypothetical protein